MNTIQTLRIGLSRAFIMDSNYEYYRKFLLLSINKKLYEAFLDGDIRTTIFNWKLLYAILLYGVMAYLTQPQNVSEISQK